MIDHILYFLLVVVLSVSMSNFLDNALGYPGKEYATDIDAGAILFQWTYFISYDRVLRMRGETFIRDLRNSVLAEFTEKHDLFTAENDFKRAIVGEARKYFTWERAFGMCIYCTNFWISVAVCVFFGTVNPLESSIPFYFLLLTTPFLSHQILKHVNNRTD